MSWQSGMDMTNHHESSKSIVLQSIGWAESEIETLEGMPIQAVGDTASPGCIVLHDELEPGLKDLEGFSHAILIYHFHKTERSQLLVKPFLDTEERGVFATRTPVRPNPIGLSVVEIERIEKNKIYIKKLDVLNGTPILDIKPYVPEFDSPRLPVEIGWYSNKVSSVSTQIADKGFLY